jgi:hypothetical protein
VPGNLRIGIIAVRTVCPFKTRVNKIFRVAKHGFITQVKNTFSSILHAPSDYVIKEDKSYYI